MAMLAEPRRKQKWSVDPRNNNWSNDESKFGQKMLEKMGWSKGKGLGKDEQGATEHIKVKVKNNSLGLGTVVNHEDNWIAHQDDFNQILANLNNCHGQSESTDEEKKPVSFFSLEEKSKTSRKRVHYMKFTKGKDLSSRSETDLACIFGKRGKQSNDKEGSSDQDSQEEKELEEEENVIPGSEVEATINTVTSTLTMQEYFAQRMARLRNGCQEKHGLNVTPDASEDSVETNEKKHKTKKKKKKSEEELEDNKREQSSGSTGRKKKKRRPADKEERLEPETESTTSSYEEHLGSGAGDACETQHCTDRKRKKHKRPSKDRDVEEKHTVAQEEADDTDKAHKGRKKRKEEQAVEVTEETKPKKDKKTKRKHKTLSEN
ncbi:PIN2/TERF1-interacting telomerase inhibitor 1 [Arapaima gigas]